MDNKLRKKCADAMYELYPIARKRMYHAFDDLDPQLTRTQQIILLSLSVKDNLSMSQLANSICTSNEQATRAVTQLVNMGFVNRAQNKTNRRVVNISLTDKAKAYIDASKKKNLAETEESAERLSDEQAKAIYDAVMVLVKAFKNAE